MNGASGALLLLLAHAAVAQESLPRLEPGVPVDREAPDAAPDLFTIEVAANQYVELSAERLYGEIELRLLKADGTLLGSIRGESPSGSSLRLARVVEAAGPCRLEVTAHDPAANRRGHYRLVLEELRAAAPGDPECVAAFGQIDEGRRAFADAADEAARTAAIAQLDAALAQFREAGSPAGEAIACEALAHVHHFRGDSKALVADADAALAAWRRAGRRREEGRARSRVGYAAYVAFDRTKVLEEYEAALAIHDEVGDLEGRVETLERLGWYWRWSGDRVKAIAAYEQALPLRAQVHDWPGELGTLSDLGLACLELGDVAAAREHLERALALASPDRDANRMARLYLVLGLLQSGTGDYRAAIETFRRSIDAAVRFDLPRNEAAALANLGIVYDCLGQFEEERDCLVRAFALAHSMGMRNGECSILCSLSVAYRELGQDELAQTHAEQALALSRDLPDAELEALALRNLGSFALDRGELEEGLEQLERSLALFEQVGVRKQVANVLALIADACDKLGDPERAAAASQRSLAIDRSMKNALHESWILADVARRELEAGDRVNARAHAEEAVRISESLRQQLAQPDWRASYFARAQHRYELLVDVLLSGPADADHAAERAADVAQALEVSERARARSLLDLLVESQIDVREGVDPRLLAREQELRHRINYQASEQERLRGRKETEAQAIALAPRLDDLTRGLHEVEAEVRSSSPRFGALMQPEPLRAAAIQRELLDGDTVLLEFMPGERRSWLFAVTPESLAAVALPPTDAIAPLARAVCDAVVARLVRTGESDGERRARLGAADAAFAAKSAELSRTLFAPIAAQLEGDWQGKRLVIVAPGALAFVPFAALPAIAGREVVSLPSASTLAAVRREAAGRPRGERLLALVADPVFEADDPRVAAAARRAGPPAASGVRSRFGRLPFSREEAQTIAELVPAAAPDAKPGEALLLATGFDANRALALGGELARCRFVHFATHGILDGDHPELSGLVLSLVDADGAPQDGILRLGDIYNLRLPVEMVVLSACQTALGREVGGEGLVGLTRGFMYAGAERVVASLWQVDDLATAELMRRFYRGLLQEGRRPAAALRDAQLELSRDPRWAAPYFWAGFVLHGEWR